MTRRICFSLVVLAVLGWVPPARADLAAPEGYLSKVSGNTVTVTPWNSQGRTCPDSSGMLRQNTSSLEVVKLADFCAPATADQLAAYVDECVPPGVYRYGLATPYQCKPFAGGTYYYEEVAVTTPVDGCILSDGDPGATAAPGVPWTDQQLICKSQYVTADGCSTVPGGAGHVLLVDLLAFIGGAFFLLRARRRRG